MASSNQFKEILNAAKEKRGDLPVDTMIVSSHLSQMRMFILRRGIEFYSEQDSYGGRKTFLKKVYEHNMLEMKPISCFTSRKTVIAAIEISSVRSSM